MIVQFCSDWPIQLRRRKQLFCSVSCLLFTQVVFKLFSLHQVSVPWLLALPPLCVFRCTGRRNAVQCSRFQKYIPIIHVRHTRKVCYTVCLH